MGIILQELAEERVLWCPFNGPPILLADILEFELSFLFDEQDVEDSVFEGGTRLLAGMSSA